MIDTIKISTPLHNPLRRSSLPFQLFKEDEKGIIRGVLNPTARMKQTGRYFPRVTYTERPARGGKSYELAIELSLPKLMFNNNFSELVDTDFDDVLKKLSMALREMGVGWYFSQHLETFSVSKIDYSKNIVFNDYTPVSSIIKNIMTANISKVYDIQKTDFRNGGYVLHIHTNSLDIVFYDKVADLGQAKISEKRAIEKNNLTQLNLFDELGKHRSLSVARFEVRLNGKAKIRKSLQDLGLQVEEITFQNLFKKDISRKILLSHWQNILASIPKTPLDDATPDTLLTVILKDDAIKPQQAFAKLGFMLVLSQHNTRYIRTLIDNRFNKNTWARLNKMRAPPEKTQLKTLLRITEIIQEMKPTNLEELDLVDY